MQKSYINEYLNFISLLHIHKQKIVAVIMCDTGIALLAYMDGITNSPSLRGVVLAALRWIYSRFFKREHFSEISDLKRLISIHNIFQCCRVCCLQSDVSEGNGRSTNWANRIHIHCHRNFKCCSIMANLCGALFLRGRKYALGSSTVDCPLNS